MVLNPAGEDILVLCEACGYAANRQVATDPASRARRRRSRCRWRRSRRPGRRRSPTLAAFLGIGPESDREGHLLRDRRRAARDGDRPRRPRGQRDEAAQRRQGDRAACGRRRVEEIQAAGHGAGLRLADRRARHGRRRRRARRPLAEPRRRREPRRLPPPERQRRARLHGRRRHRHHQRPRGRSLPDVRLAGRSCATASRSATSSSSARSTPTRSGATYLGEDGVEHPIVMGSYGIGVGRNVACIVEAHHDDKGIVWPAEVAPYAAHLVVDRRQPRPAGRRDRRAAPRASRSPPAARSSTTTATSRRASSSPTPSCSGCPGS